METLKTSDFTDLFLERELRNSLCRRRGNHQLTVIPETFSSDIRALFNIIESQARNAPSLREFSVPYDDVMYRVAIIPDMTGMVFAVRKGTNYLPPFESCGIDPDVASHLVKSLSGLIIVSGAFETGKTTLAGAFCVRYAAQGALCVTLEDPPEIPLSGHYGTGRILQVQISREDIEKAIEESLRMSFDLLFVSEIRTSTMAEQLVHVSSNGRLAITTIHADSAVGAVTKLATMGGGDEKNGKVFREMLGSSLLAVLHMGNGTDGRRGVREYLLDLPLRQQNQQSQSSSQIKSQIMAGEYQSLQNSVNKVRNVLSLGLSLADAGK